MILDLLKATKGNADVLGKLIPDIRGLGGIMSLSAREGKTFAENMEAMMNSVGASDDAFNDMANTLDQRMKKSVQELNNEWSKLVGNTGEARLAVVDFAKTGIKWFNEFLERGQEFGTELFDKFAQLKEDAKEYAGTLGELFKEDESKGFFENLFSNLEKWRDRIHSITQEKIRQREIDEESRNEAAQKGVEVAEKYLKVVKGITEATEEQTRSIEKQTKKKVKQLSAEKQALEEQKTLIGKYKDVLKPGLEKIVDNLNVKLQDGLKKIEEQTERIIKKIRAAFGGSAFQQLAEARANLKDNPQALDRFNKLVSQVDLKTITPRAIKDLSEAAVLFTKIGAVGKRRFKINGR